MMPEQPPPPSSIVVVLTDQQQYRTIANQSPVKTPQLDRLRQQGAVRFANAFCPSPICTPSRASIQTGLLPHQHRLVHNTHRHYHLVADLAPDTPTLGSRFTAAGYHTAYIGKWHVGRTRMPDQIGYQEFLEPSGPKGVTEVLSDEVRIPGEGPRSLLSAVTDRPPEQTEPFLIMAAAARRVREWAPGGEPFFLFVSTLSPHVPCRTPGKYVALYDPATLPLPDSFADVLDDRPESYRHFNWQNFCSLAGRPEDARRFLSHYYGQITLLDDAFGGLVRALEETGLRENTWIVFASDHGELAGAHGLIGKDDLMCEELIRVPLVIAPPRAAGRAEAAGEVVRGEFVTLTDLFATCLELGGVPGEVPPSSRSLAPLLRGETGTAFPDEVVVTHHGSQCFNAVRAIRDSRYKFVFRAHEKDELYDLAEDPGERRNRLDDPSLAPVLRRLSGRLVACLDATQDPAAAGARNQMLGQLPSVYLVGDSISLGYGPFLERALGPGVTFARKTGREAALAALDVPAGANNGDSASCLEWLQAQLAAGGFRPDLLVLNCGLHDLKTDHATRRRQVEPQAYRANLEALVRAVREAGIPVLWVSTTPVNESLHNSRKPFSRFERDVAEYNRIANDIMNAAGIPVADLGGYTAKLEWRSVSGDGVHFPEAIQRQQGIWLAGAVAPRLEQSLRETGDKALRLSLAESR